MVATIPNQKKIVASLMAGKTDENLGKKLRSTH